MALCRGMLDSDFVDWMVFGVFLVLLLCATGGVLQVGLSMQGSLDLEVWESDELRILRCIDFDFIVVWELEGFKIC